MKQTDQTKSTLVAGVLLASAVFIIAITVQHWPVYEKIVSPAVEESISENIDTDEPEFNSNEYEIDVQVVSLEDTIPESIRLTFDDAFKNANNKSRTKIIPIFIFSRIG